MKKKIVFKILIGIVVFAVLTKVLTVVFFEPWVGRKIQKTLNEASGDYTVEIGKVHFLILAAGIELEKITICSSQEPGIGHHLNGEVASIKIKGISFLKALRTKDIEIRSVTIVNSDISGKFSSETPGHRLSPASVSIGTVTVEKLDIALKDTSSAEAYTMKDGNGSVYRLQLMKDDTISSDLIERFDFNAKEFHFVSPDSLYSFKASGIVYSATSEAMTIDSAFILPNYEDYDFTSRHQFQTDRVEAAFQNIRIRHLAAVEYIRSKSLLSSSVEIGHMDANIFRDRRKQLKHVNRPMLQDIVREYPGKMHIDSIHLANANITYIEHAEQANHPGRISFNEINTHIYGITNDTCYKAENKPMKILFEALLMGKSKLSLSSEMKLFDRRNTFSLSGSLSSMDGPDLNPILERNSFIYVTSGRIDRMHFNFTANKDYSKGEMIMRYHDFSVAVKNKRTDDTTAIKERLITVIANMKIRDANPTPGKEVRIGTIETNRDPERFLFYYCLDSILSGIKSSLVDRPRRQKKK